MTEPVSGAAWRGKLPMLLKHDGSYFPELAYVRDYLPPTTRTFPEVTTFANNATGFSNVGDPKTYIDSMTVEAWGVATYRQIKNDIAAEASRGLFVLEVPNLSGSGGDAYLVRFFEASFSRLYDRRLGAAQIFSATLESVEVLGQSAL